MMADWPAGGWLGLGVALAFLADWAAVWLDWKMVKPFTKPLAMLMLILWTALSTGQEASPFLGLLLAAQAFGLLGDILLLLPEKAFLLGLASFLVGHVIYLALLISSLLNSFSITQSFIPAFGWILGGGVLWAVLLALVYHFFQPLHGSSDVLSRLWMAVQSYVWILCALVALSLMAALRVGGPISGRVTLVLGAFLFLASDLMLTYNRFIHPFNRAQLWVRITYHLAQFGLAWGLLNLLNPVLFR